MEHNIPVQNVPTVSLKHSHRNGVHNNLRVAVLIHISSYIKTCHSTVVVPISVGTLMLLVGVATFIAGVVMLRRGKRVLHHSSQPPPPGTDHYELVDGGKRAPLGAGVYATNVSAD